MQNVELEAVKDRLAEMIEGLEPGDSLRIVRAGEPLATVFREASTAFKTDSLAESEPIFDPKAKPLWEEIEAIMADVPREIAERIPSDAAEQLDHYLYGSPKRSE